MKTKISRTVFDNLQANATREGIIAAAAMDQRGSLKRALESAGANEVDAQDLREFKALVVEGLSCHSSAFLLDPTYGLEAGKRRAPECGLLLAYERSGYDTSTAGRKPDLLDEWSAQRLLDAGATGVKLLVYYNPAEAEEINDYKHAFVERVGAECEAVGLPLFLEPVTYAEGITDPLELARTRPERVRGTMEEFSKPQYRVNVLKVEFPVDPLYVQGLSQGDRGTAYGLDEAGELIAQAAQAATKPFIYLSAGVDMDVFTHLLQLSSSVGAGFNGVLCGRATWKGGIGVYARQGADALRDWLQYEGTSNIRKLNQTVNEYARPWWEAYGGMEKIEIV